jgi:trehalose 6-phosphate synthase/phosphatase
MLPTVQTGYEELKEKHGKRMIIAGLDIGQRLSGITLKFLAFERLLQDYPSWQNKVVMVQRVLLPNSRKADETNTVRELRFLVKRIQDTFGPKVMDYQEMVGTSMPMDQRLALWKSADVLMLTPIREGLNHWPMEYIYARKEPSLPGVVIASEFSAVCSILNGALRVNPFDIQMTITTIDKALSMDMQEREGRRYRDIDFVSTSPSEKWTRNVLRDLSDAIYRQPQGDTSSSSTPGTPMPGQKELIDSTAAYLARESANAFTELDPSSVKKAVDASSRRVLIFDFNGTIVIKEPPGKYLKREILGTSGNKPPPEVSEFIFIGEATM